MIEVGPFVLQYSILYLIISLIAGIIFLTYISPFQGEDNKARREISFNGLFTLILVMQFSTILTQFDLALSNPLVAIAYPSGQSELWLGTLALILYMVYSVRKHAEHYIEDYVGGLLFIVIASEMVFVTLSATPIVSIILLTGLGGLLVLKYIVLSRDRKGVWLALMIWSLLHMITVIGFNHPFLFGIILQMPKRKG